MTMNLGSNMRENEVSIKYHLPVLSTPDFGLFRGPGPGLGNLLLPVARAVIGREYLGGEVVMPTMRQIKVGPFLRREADKRTYGNIFRARTPSEWINWAAAHSKRCRDEGHEDCLTETIRYSGLGGYFHDLWGHHEIVSQFLGSVSRSSTDVAPYDVALHIRLGDFAAPTVGGGQVNTRVTFEWYLEALEAVRCHLGKKYLKGIVFTDADPVFLIEKLGLKNFEPEVRSSALASMFAMANAKVLVASQSTFSLWGQYLGNNHVFWPSTFDLARYKPVDPELDHFL